MECFLTQTPKCNFKVVTHRFRVHPVTNEVPREKINVSNARTNTIDSEWLWDVARPNPAHSTLTPFIAYDSPALLFVSLPNISESCRRVISKSRDDSDENAVHNRWYMLNEDMQGLRSEPLWDLPLTKLLQQETLFYSDVCIAAGIVFLLSALTQEKNIKNWSLIVTSFFEVLYWKISIARRSCLGR